MKAFWIERLRTLAMMVIVLAHANDFFALRDGNIVHWRPACCHAGLLYRSPVFLPFRLPDGPLSFWRTGWPHNALSKVN